MTLPLPNRVRRRSAGLIGLVLFLAALTLTPALATAGQGGRAPASIIGQVTDESGAVLPGVTVTTTSPALQVPQMTAVTDEHGEYRLTPLPIGTYAVDYALQGFQTLRVANVQLPVGFVAKLNQVMKIGAVAESVTVSGASPLIDSTSAATRTSLTGEALLLIPGGRSGVEGLLSQVPGVRANIDVGGASPGDSAKFESYGQSASTWSLMEGVLNLALTPAGNGSHYDFNTVEGARIQTSGNDAEMPRRGMMIDAIVKSGGNEYHGDVMWSQTADRFQSNNIDDAQRARGLTGATNIVRRWDGNASLGGKLIENRLWFFTHGRHRQSDNYLPAAVNPDGSPVLHPQWQAFQVNKISAQLSANNKLIIFNSWSGAMEKRGATLLIPVQSMNENDSRYKTFKTEWQAVRGNSIVLSLQYGYWNWRPAYHGFDPGVPASMDVVTLKQDGDALMDGIANHGWHHHNRGVATIYRPDLFAGNHEFKLGFDNFLASYQTQGLARRSGDYQLLFSSGAPFEINTVNNPSAPLNKMFYLGVYAQDAWTVGRRLTVNLGLRGAHDHAWIPAQCQVAGQFVAAQCFPEVQPNVWNTLAPRLHAAYDLSGDGKTVIKGGWGRFIHLREVGGYEITQLNPAAPTTTTWRWHDLNGNRDYNPGEINLDPNGPDFVSYGSLTKGIVNPDERIPREDEYSVAFERQLVGDLAVRVSGIYTKNTNVNRNLNPLLPYDAYNIPINNLDPGPDGVLGTADDTGKVITYYDYPAALRGAKFQTVMLVNNDSKNDNTYKTIEVAGTKRLARNWQLASSFSATKRHVPFGDSALAPLVLNPNAEINVADDNWLWIGKVSGSYGFPKGILGSFNFDMRQGEASARQVLLRGGSSIPSIAVNVEPVGSFRLPTTKLLDLRAAKRFNVGRNRMLDVHLDCFNSLNINVPVGTGVGSSAAVTVRSGPSFLLPTAIILPRVLQLEGRFTF